MSKVVFTGCSFTEGVGWVDTDPTKADKKSPNLWVNLCHDQIDQLNSLELLNYGKGGASNEEVFKNSVNAIANNGASIVVMFCEWTSMPRYNFRTGIELWATSQALAKTNRGQDKNQPYINDIIDRFLALIHLQDEILKVVEYTNILQKLAKQLGIRLYHINGLCPWDTNYFVQLNNIMPEAYTKFTKQSILEIDRRNDEDIFKLYKLIHNEYDQAGGVDPACWINLYGSMQQNIIDTNYDKKHPGTQSNQLYFEQIKKFLETQ